jgi:hypothetical protein
MKLWQAEVGGARYWLAAETHAEAFVVLERHVVDDEGGDWDPARDDVAVSECPADRAARINFADETTDRRSSMQAEFERDPSARVIACSEW